MRQTVVGVYDGYADACSAQRALTEAGISQADISIYATSPSTPSAGGPRVYAPGGIDVRRDRPVFDQLEQLFSRLFKRGEYPPETEDYREVIRRGGAIVSVDISEVQTDLACDVMRRTGAADIEERAKAWRERSDAAAVRESNLATGSGQASTASIPEHSLGQQQRTADIGTDTASVMRTGAVPNESPMPTGKSSAMQGSGALGADPSAPTGSAPLASHAAGPTPAASVEAGQQGIASGVPGDVSDVAESQSARGPRDAPLQSGAELSSDDDKWSDGATNTPESAQVLGSGYAGDPGIDALSDESAYDEEFRRDYDSRYANTNAPYDDYHRAYTHGASFANDERFRGREWPEVEEHAKEHWESRYPGSAWERFKAAVRHGWERVVERR